MSRVFLFFLDSQRIGLNSVSGGQEISFLACFSKATGSPYETKNQCLANGKM